MLIVMGLMFIRISLLFQVSASDPDGGDFGRVRYPRLLGDDPVLKGNLLSSLCCYLSITSSITADMRRYALTRSSLLLGLHLDSKTGEISVVNSELLDRELVESESE